MRRARGGPRTVTLTGAPVKRVDWECGQKLTVQGTRLGVHFVEVHPEKTLYQDAARRSTGRLAESAARCDRQRGRALQCGSKDAGERIEVGDDRGGAYMVPSADAPIQSRQEKE